MLPTKEAQSSWIFPLFWQKALFPVFVTFHLSLNRQPTMLSCSLCLSWSAAPELSQWIYKKGPESSSSCGRMPSSIHSHGAFSKGAIQGTSSFVWIDLNDVHGVDKINKTPDNIMQYENKPKAPVYSVRGACRSVNCYGNHLLPWPAVQR